MLSMTTLARTWNAAQAWLEAWKKKAEEMGFDLWQNQGSSQRGQAGEIQSVSQESFSRVEGPCDFDADPSGQH